MGNVRRAVITGATKGIGRAIAESLAKEGYHLAICARNNNDLEEMTDALFQINDTLDIVTLAVDVSIKPELKAFADLITQEWDHVDVLVNNAGMFVPGGVLSDEEGVLEKTIETNLYSAYYLTRDLYPLLKVGDGAHIFNMSSIAALKAYPGGGSYSISKFALRGLSIALRDELKGEGIKVTTLYPGATWSHSWAGADLPKDRLMQASDIAEAVMSALRMSPSAVVEEIIIRPQLGDL